MFRNVAFVSSMMLASVAIAAITPAARADSAAAFAMITIDNPTNNVVHYQVKWGDGEWESFSLSPGRYRNHYHALDDDERAPTPRIRFDGVLNDGEVTYLTYKLEFFASYFTGYSKGKVYQFRTRGGGSYLDLLAR